MPARLPADNFITAYLPHRYHLSMQLDSPANAASELHEASQKLRKQKHTAKGSSSSGSSDAKAAAGADKQQQQPGGASSSSDSSRPLCNETWWRLYCAGDVLACHLAQAMDQGLNLQVCWPTCVCRV
jgi:hypothetical protein